MRLNCPGCVSNYWCTRHIFRIDYPEEGYCYVGFRCEHSISIEFFCACRRFVQPCRGHTFWRSGPLVPRLQLAIRIRLSKALMLQIEALLTSRLSQRFQRLEGALWGNFFFGRSTSGSLLHTTYQTPHDLGNLCFAMSWRKRAVVRLHYISGIYICF